MTLNHLACEDDDNNNDKKPLRMKNVQVWDYWVRVVLRFVAMGFFSLLIVGQTTIVYYLVWEALQTNQLESLSIVFTALVTGTLVETYLIVREMIRWIFTDNPYEQKKNREE